MWKQGVVFCLGMSGNELFWENNRQAQRVLLETHSAHLWGVLPYHTLVTSQPRSHKEAVFASNCFWWGGAKVRVALHEWMMIPCIISSYSKNQVFLFGTLSQGAVYHSHSREWLQEADNRFLGDTHTHTHTHTNTTQSQVWRDVFICVTGLIDLMHKDVSDTSFAPSTATHTWSQKKGTR